MSYSSIRRYLSALHHHQLLERGVDPSLSTLHHLHYVLWGCHRLSPTSVHQKWLPITPAILRFLHHHWSRHSHDFDTLCYWAACCVRFFAFMRSSEFTCQSWASYKPSMLSLCNIAIDSRSNRSVIHLTLRQYKNDILRAGVTIHLGHTGDTLWPILQFVQLPLAHYSFIALGICYLETAWSRCEYLLIQWP